MGDPDPYGIAPDEVRVPDDDHYIPPDERHGRTSPPMKDYYEGVEHARRATKKYGDLLKTVTDEEGRFLAKMYVTAEYYNRHEEYKQLLETGMKLRPDRVFKAADVFQSLGEIYDVLGENCGEALRKVYPDHWSSDAANTFKRFFGVIIEHIRGEDGKAGLATVSNQTSKLVEAFGEAMAEWRHNLAVAIKVMANHDRERQEENLRAITGVASSDPIEVAGRVLNLFLKSISDVDKRGRDNDLRSFELRYDANKMERSLPNAPEVKHEDLVLHSTFEPTLK